jgi:hypothetical protein
MFKSIDSNSECGKEVSGVTPNLEFLSFLMIFYYIRCSHIVIFNQLRVPPIFFKDLKGYANQKRLKNTGLKSREFIQNKAKPIEVVWKAASQNEEKQ